jgi:hypothetical protein
VVNEKETNMQFSLELWEVHKEKKVGPSGEATEAMKTLTPNPFTKKDTKAKMVG